MFTKRLRKTFVLTAGLLAVQIAQSRDINTEYGSGAKETTHFISSYHYNVRPFDDSLSSELFDNYFKSLDPSKLYFTAKDIARFELKRKKLDDELRVNKLDFASNVYALYKKKVKAYEAFAKKQIAEGFDFAKDEALVVDRSKLTWAANAAALQELWRKKIKNDILTYKITDLTPIDDEAEKNPFQIKKKTPEERVLKRIDQFVKFLEQTDDIDILEGYIATYCKIFDPHSTYMAPRAEEDFEMTMKLSFGGIGATLRSEDGYTSVSSLIQGGPAEKSGKLNENDRIVAVSQDNGEPLNIIDMPLRKVVTYIRGKKGTNVHLTILEASKGVSATPKVITIKRDIVKLKDSEASGKIKDYKLPDGSIRKVGVITVPSFYMDFKAASEGKNFKSTTRDVYKIISDFKKKGIEGLVIDLRSNGGGSLTEAINLTGLFISSGPVVQVKDSWGKITVNRDQNPGLFYNGPMVVMLNKFSASASEIFAGAMQDYKRAVLVGDSATHGKGTVQTVNEAKGLPGSIKFTFATFYRINGESTQQRGILPDVVLPSFTDAMDIGEGTLDHALPWDSIDALSYKKYNRYTPALITALKKKSEGRRSANKDFQELNKEIKELEELRKKKSVSLNEAVRKGEFLKQKELQERQKDMLGFDKDDKKKDEEKDIILDEGIAVLNDLIVAK